MLLFTPLEPLIVRDCLHVLVFQILVAALKFFLGKDPSEEDNSDSEDDVCL